jgi:UDP-glucose 4-epimerase
MGEELVMHWAQVYKLSAVSARFFNVYGPRSRTSGAYGAVFGVFLAQKLNAKPFTIIGDGSQTRDFTYVTDVVAALLAIAMSSVSNQSYNVGSGKTVSINRLAELLGGEKVHIPKRPGEPDCTYADIDKIKHDIGWKPEISIEEGVDYVLETIEYWRNAPVWTPKSIEHATKDWFKYLA